jgi:hypothetical protein
MHLLQNASVPPLNTSYALVARILKEKGSDDVRWKEIKIYIEGRKLEKERETQKYVKTCRRKKTKFFFGGRGLVYLATSYYKYNVDGRSTKGECGALVEWEK